MQMARLEKIMAALKFSETVNKYTSADINSWKS